MKNKKQQLLEFIRLNKIDKTGIKESPYSWKELADMFQICSGCSNKQKSDTIRGLFNNNFRKKTFDIKEEEMPTLADYLQVEAKAPIANILKPSDGTYLIIPCAHAPFINKQLWKSMLSLCADLDGALSGVIILGDFLDMNALSSHDKGRMPIAGVSLGWEYEQSNTYLDSLEPHFKGLHKVYIWGNHEDRYSRYMQSPDSAKLQGAVLSPSEALKLNRRGYQVLEDWKNDEYHLGDLTLYHGDGCSKHVCHREMMVHKKSVMFCHTHRVQSYIEGKHIAYNIGCMADYKKAPIFGYASKAMKATWANGFALVHLNEGTTSVDQIVWKEDHFAYAGKIYKG